MQGFRKVDPDRWEFAHESFLRGQTHLLQRIVRRNSGHKNAAGGVLFHQHGAGKRVEEGGEEEEEEDDDNLLVEVAKLKQEQRVVEEEVRRMWRRVQETERKPKQMMAFLAKVVQNPQLLPRLKQQPSSFSSSLTPLDGGDLSLEDNASKRGRLMISSGAPSSGSWLGGEDTLLGTGGGETWLGLESVYPLTFDDGLPATENYPFVGEGAAMLAADPVSQFSSPSPLLPEFGGGGGGLDMDAAAAAAAYRLTY